MTRPGSPRPCLCLHRPTARPLPRSTSSAPCSRLNSYFHARNKKSQDSAGGPNFRFSHTPPRRPKTTDSSGGINPNADLPCYLRFTEKARVREGVQEGLAILPFVVI